MKKSEQKIHIGTLIREQLKKSGMTKSELSRRIGTSPQNIYGIFKRVTIDTGTLQLISKVLDFDFFRYYNLATEAATVENTELKRINKLNADLITENELLKEMHQLHKEKIVSLEKRILNEKEVAHL